MKKFENDKKKGEIKGPTRKTDVWGTPSVPIDAVG